MIGKHAFLRQWFKEIIKGDKISDFIRMEDSWGHNEPDGKWEIGEVYNFYTDKHRYHIVALDRGQDDDGYLGCTASARKPRAGEDWTRGNDLPDGPFVRETWDKIKNAIIRYEVVKLAPISVCLGEREPLEGEKLDHGPSLEG